MAEMETAMREGVGEAAGGCWILGMGGHGDMTLGDLSLRETAGRGFWMKRNQIGLGEVLGPDDFVLVDWDGQQIAGSGGRPSAWPVPFGTFFAPTHVAGGGSHPAFRVHRCSAAARPSQTLTPHR